MQTEIEEMLPPKLTKNQNLERGTNTCLYTKSAIYTVLTKKVRYNAFKKDIQNKRNIDILLIHIFAYGIL